MRPSKKYHREVPDFKGLGKDHRMNESNSTWETANSMFSRLRITDLGRVTQREVKLFKPGILAEGLSHQVVAPYDRGKTFVALACAKEFLDEGYRVLYLDYENRGAAIKERLALLGTSASDCSRFAYVSHPNLDMSEDSKEQWRGFLEFLRPNLIIFDSLNGFLSNAGMDENSSTGFQSWANTHLKVPRELDITTLVIDHAGWDSTRSRGTSRKPDEFDIVWNVEKAQKFSRSTVGQLDLRLLKDRDSLIDDTRITFTIGGDPFQFWAEPTDEEDPGISGDNKLTLDLVSRNTDGRIGTPRKSINELFGGSKSRADRTIKFLLGEDLIYQPDGSKLYWIVDPATSPQESAQESDMDPSVDGMDGAGVPGSRSSRTGPSDLTPHTGIRPDDPLGKDAKDENDSTSRGDSIVDGKTNLADNVVIRTEDVLEEIDTLDFNARGIEVLKAVALVYLDHPMMTLTTPPHLAEKQRRTIIGLAQQDGTTIDGADLDKADPILRGNPVFAAAIRRRIKKMFEPGFNPDYEGGWGDWD